jgi:PTS system galactitol-specific IIA component
MSALFHESLILTDLKLGHSHEALKVLAQALQKEGYVKDSYYEALIDREENFATGLPGEGVNVAIPHADPIHVNENAIAIGICKTPVDFKMMGNHDETLGVEIIFMLALKDGYAHVNVLSQLMGVLQNEEVLSKLKSIRSQSELLEVLNEHIH